MKISRRINQGKISGQNVVTTIVESQRKLSSKYMVTVTMEQVWISTVCPLTFAPRREAGHV